jgi:hypothetical protein
MGVREARRDQMAFEYDISDEARRTAAQCRHYAMCKIDYLGTGLCPPAEAYPFVSYFPQGRMDLCSALDRGLVPVTEGAVDIIESCSLCGRCDRQCHFTTEMRPLTVMKEMKAFLQAYLKAGRSVERTNEDDPLKALRQIVGPDWAVNDPALLVAYANDPFPLAGMRMPGYVVLPQDRKEVIRIVRLANRLGLPYVVRGNGGSVFGFVFTDGIVIDMNRMKRIEIDKENWTVAVEPGVTSFELQSAVAPHGFRINTAEPAATVCGNIVCTGTFSTWANVYGVGADAFVDMEFVDKEGRVFHLNDRGASNFLAFEHDVLPAPGICTRAHVRLHPVTEDEDGLLVPFSSFSEAVAFATDLSRRRIGLAIGVLGGHYLSTFMAPSALLADAVKEAFSEGLGVDHVVFVIGDHYALKTIRNMVPCVIDSRFFRAVMLGLPRLVESGWKDIVMDAEGDRPGYEIFFMEEMRPVVEAVLDPCPETLAEGVPEDLRQFYIDLYHEPRMTDMVWLNMFRIISARMSRQKHMFAFLVYVPPGKIEVVEGIIKAFAETAERHGISHDFGFLTPLDLGKRAILEYDYYIDHIDPGEAQKIEKAMAEIEPMLDQTSAKTKGVKWLKYIFSQGCCRKESYLYT